MDEPSKKSFIDARLPLPWLITTICAVVFSALTMFFKMDKLSEEMVELKATVRASVAVSTVMQNELAVLRWRVDNLEKKELHKP